MPAGCYQVTLSDEAANCTVTSANPQTANVPSGETATTSFTVSCAATLGNLTVSNSTTGSNLDPDGYTVTVSGSAGTGSQTMATNGNVIFAKITTATCRERLSGQACNCTVTSATPPTANVPAGGTATTNFTVSCAATTTTGTLTVSNSTTGSDLDPDGYTVTVSGSAGTGSQTMATNGNVIFA